MGDQENIVKAILAALSNETVIEKFREAIVSPIEFDFKQLQDSNNKLMREISSLKESNDNLFKTITYWKNQNEEKQRKIEQMEMKITELEIKSDELEQYSRRNSLRIQGLPEVPGEDLLERVLYLARNRMSVEIDEADIDRLHRIGPPSSKREILIKFTSYKAKEIVFKCRSGLRKHADPPEEFDPEINTNDDDDDDLDKKYGQDLTRDRIFINEDLTKTRNHLLWKARQLKKEKKIFDCWSFDGRILIKKLDNKIINIRHVKDLNDQI